MPEEGGLGWGRWGWSELGQSEGLRDEGTAGLDGVVSARAVWRAGGGGGSWGGYWRLQRWGGLGEPSWRRQPGQGES